MSIPSIKPDKQIMHRVEELLREQLEELGIDIASLPPERIAESMHCAVYPSGLLCYSWQGRPLLDVEPEELSDGSLRWRFFTRENPLQ